ncbi:MAG TPA: hypothetical protein VGQ93_14800 [Lysobacter sp.]|jgi:hypothetical protein|nr:hypothetical protein [Lysobacter sp.]
MRRLRFALIVLLLASASTAVAMFLPPTRTAGLQVAEQDRRTPDQTFLTFPEWFLVFSPAEYAESLHDAKPSSAFPFFGHIAQFWSSYGQVIRATRPYPFNGEYHTMIVVIGASTTVEYGIKGAYETLIGRLTELTAAPNATPEDRLATEQAQAYVDFIRVRPWYEFDFVTPLKRLWTQTPYWGPHALRKWERRYMLTSEWLIKASYAALIEKATHSAFEIPLTTTAAVVTNLPEDAGSGLPELKRLQQQGTQALITVPRYQAFTDYAMTLSQRGVHFDDIAGNRGVILVSVVTPMAQPVPADTTVLIRQPIVTRAGFERRVLQVPVARLGELLAGYAASGDRVEHVFDY